MNKRFFRYLAIAFIVASWGSDAFCQTEVSVGVNKSWIFGFDADLNLMWKTSNNGFSSACSNDQFFVLLDERAQPPVIKVLRNTDGKELWSHTLSATPEGYGIGTRFGRSSFFLTFDVGDSLRTDSIDLETGKLRESTISPKKNTFAGTCRYVLPDPSDTLNFFNTSKYVCGIAPDLSIIWRQRLREGEQVASTSGGHALLRGGRTLRVISKKDGSQLWQREYQKDIRMLFWGGSSVVIRLADGSKDSVDAQSGNSLMAK